MSEKMFHIDMIYGHIELMPLTYVVEGNEIRCFLESRTFDRNGNITNIKKSEGATMVCGSDKQAKELLKTVL